MNSDLSDIGTALTGSLARDGQGGMTAVLHLNTTGFTYTNDTNTGMYRSGSDAQAIKCGGSDIVEISSTGLDVTGTILQNGISILPVGLGPLPWSRVAAPSGWVFVGRLYSRSTYAALWTVAQAEIALGSAFYTNGDGSTTFGVGLTMPGRLPVCNDSISGSAAGTVTQTVFGSSPAVVGNVGGDEDYALLQSALPNVGLAVNGTASVTSSVADILRNPSGVQTAPAGIGQGVGSGASGVPGYSIASTGTVTANTVPMNGGVTQTRYKALPPGIITNYIIFAGV